MKFRPEAAAAACALDADVLVFTEYFPQDHHQRFLDDLAAAGWTHTLLSTDTGGTGCADEGSLTRGLF